MPITPVLGAFLLKRFVGHHDLLDRASSVFKFVVIGGLLIWLVAATFGTTSMCLGGIAPWSAYKDIWWTWWMGNVGGVLVFTPALLIWSKPLNKLKAKILKTREREIDSSPIEDEAFAPLPISKVAEGAILLVLVLVSGQIAFGGGYPVAYMLIPLLVWSAFRFGQRGATLLIVIVSAIAILGTVHGFGPFVRDSLNESLVLLDSFIGVVAVTTLVLAAVLKERQIVEKALRQSESQLREQSLRLEQSLRDLQLTQSQLIQSEKLSILGQLVAGVAHEINNPVNFIYGNLIYADQYTQDLLKLLNLYQQQYPQPLPAIESHAEAIDLDFLISDLPKLLSSMKIGADRIQQIVVVVSLRNFSRVDESEMKSVDIHDGIDSTLLILQNRLKTRSGNPTIQVSKEYGCLPKIECYPGQLNQVFINLISNAIDALESSHRSAVNAQLSADQQQTNLCIQICTEVPDSNRVLIRIKDNGPGMALDVQKRLFDPFFTTKPMGKGTGLGLAISFQIVVEKHKGQLRCSSTPGMGTEFVVEVPIRQASGV